MKHRFCKLHDLMRGYFTYIMRSWIATIITTPVVFSILLNLFFPSTFSEYPFYKLGLILIFLGFIVSVPSLLLLGVVSIYLERSTRDIKTLKLVTILISIVLIILSFVFFFQGAAREDMFPVIALAITYIISIIVFGLYFKIKKPQHHRSFF